MSLTDTKCRTAKPRRNPFKLTDGNGLYLEVKPNGALVGQGQHTAKSGLIEARLGLRLFEASISLGKPARFIRRHRRWALLEIDVLLAFVTQWNIEALAGH